MNLLLLNVGFLWFIKNVLSKDLDLRNFQNEGFTVRDSAQAGCKFTEITPNLETSISAVKNNSETVWKPNGSGVCVGVVLISNGQSDYSLMYLEVIKDSKYIVNYYENASGSFRQISKDKYSSKLDHLKNGTVLEVTETDSSKRNRIQNNNTHSEEPLGRKLKDEIRRRKKLTENKSHNENGGEPTSNETNSTLEHSSDKSTPVVRKKVVQNISLDISEADKMSGVEVKYDTDELLPVMTATPVQGTRVTKVYQNDNLIWDGEGDGAVYELKGYAFYGEYRMVDITYSRDMQVFRSYFNKYQNEWEEVSREEFEKLYKELGSHFRKTREQVRLTRIPCIKLNLANSNENNKFLQRSQKLGEYNATVYFPLNEYKVNSVEDGNKVLWRSDGKRCVSASVVREDKLIRLVKLDLVKVNGDKTEEFYKKVHGSYSRIGGNEFYKFLNSADEDEVHSETESELDSESDQGETRDSEPSPYSGFKPSQLNVGSRELFARVDENTYEGVKYKTFTPFSYQVFNVVTIPKGFVWRGNDDLFSDYVRVFYLNWKPKMAFMRVTENKTKKSRDEYYVEKEGKWKEVSFLEFKTFFDSNFKNNGSNSSQNSENGDRRSGSNNNNSSQYKKFTDDEPLKSNVPFSYSDHHPSSRQLGFYYDGGFDLLS